MAAAETAAGEAARPVVEVEVARPAVEEGARPAGVALEAASLALAAPKQNCSLEGRSTGSPLRPDSLAPAVAAAAAAPSGAGATQLLPQAAAAGKGDAPTLRTSLCWP